MDLTASHLLVGTVLVLGAAFAVSVVDTARVRRTLDRRFHYGLPWGTLLTTVLLVAFYLFVQRGMTGWNEPVVYAYVSWSYFYPTGILTAGFAHGSPAHLLGNLTALVVFGTIVEYAWGHYPESDDPGKRSDERESGVDASEMQTDDPDTSTDANGVRTDESDSSTDANGVRTDDPDSSTTVNGAHNDESDSSGDSNGVHTDESVGESATGRFDGPWARIAAVSVGLCTVALATGIFSLGPGLGFSGAVYATMGFAVVAAPRLAIGAVVLTSGLSVLRSAITEPVVTETIDVGPPAPPGWAGIGFHAHLLGFVIGGLAAVWLCRRRGRSPTPAAIFGAALLVGLVQAVWLLVWSSATTYTMYRGAGVAMLVVLAAALAVASAGSDRPVPRLLAFLPRAPTRRQLAWTWLVLLVVVAALALGSLIAFDGVVWSAIAVVLVGFVFLSAPALGVVLGQRLTGGAVGRRRTALVSLVAFTVILALVTIPLGFGTVGEAPGSDGLEVGDYTITYEQNATGERSMPLLGGDGESTYDGLLVYSDDREILTVEERPEVIEHEGNATVTVGGIGWDERVLVERVGWDVLGNDTAYAVDLTADGETTRSFTTDPVRAEATIDDDATMAVEPTGDGFAVTVERDGTAVGSAPIPDPGESVTVEAITFSTETPDDRVVLYAETDDVRLQIAEQETFS